MAPISTLALLHEYDSPRVSQRVAQLSGALAARGLRLLQSDGVSPHNSRNAVAQADAALVFLSRRYIAKITQGAAGMRCKQLLSQALQRMPKNMVAVLLEQRMLDTSLWGQELQQALGRRPFVAFWDEDQLEDAVNALVHELTRNRKVAPPPLDGPGGVESKLQAALAGRANRTVRKPAALHAIDLLTHTALASASTPASALPPVTATLDALAGAIEFRNTAAAGGGAEAATSAPGLAGSARYMYVSPTRLRASARVALHPTSSNDANNEAANQSSDSVAGGASGGTTHSNSSAFHSRHANLLSSHGLDFVPASLLLGSSSTGGAAAPATAATSTATSPSATPLVQFDRRSVPETVAVLRRYANNASVVAQACINLRDLTVSSDTARLEVTSRGGIEAILARMYEHRTHPRLLENACRALINLAVNDSVESAIVARHGVDAIVVAMQSHPADVALQTQGAWALRNLSFALCNKLAVARGGGIAAVLAAMRAHPTVSEVQEHGLWALRNLSAADELKLAIAEARGIETALEAMRRHAAHAGVQKQGCGALANLAADAINRKHIGEVGGIETILDAMRNHLVDAEVQVQAAWSLKNLSFNGPANRATVARLNGIEVIKDAMRAHPDHAGVQEQALRAFWNLSYENPDNRKAIGTADGRELVEMARRLHPGVEAVQEAAAGTLGNLFEGPGNNQS